MRILFVDDEKNILTGLKRMLHGMKKEWEMYFVQSGEEAVKLIESVNPDLVVVDMKMPGMDGLTLLEFINNNYPEIIRIVLTGHTDEEYITKSIKTSHQFILKPTSKEELISRIRRVVDLKKYLISPELKQVVSGVDKIPSLPKNYLKIEKELNAKEPSLSKISDIIEKEPVITAKILQIANSAYFGLAATVCDIRQALNILGLNSIRSILFYLEIFQYNNDLKSKLFTIDDLWKHSLLIGNLTKTIYETLTRDKTTSKHAYIAGLLHDIGYLLISQIPGYDENINRIMNEENIEKYSAEMKWKNISHAEVGAYLLGIWNLPKEIITAVADHHKTEITLHKLDFASAIKFAQLWEINPDELESISQKELPKEIAEKLLNNLKRSSNGLIID